MKHIDARLAWVQSLRDKDVVRLIKVPGAENAADFYTKVLNGPEFRRQLKPKKRVKAVVQVQIGESVCDFGSRSDLGTSVDGAGMPCDEKEIMT